MRERGEEVRAARKADRQSTANPFNQVHAIHNPQRIIGRERELARLRTMLSGGSVVILGPPKIGKSSLLRKLAASWEGEVLGPIDFQVIEDRDDFHDCLADELKLKDGRWRNVRKALRERQVLLLLDELDSAPAKGIMGDDLGPFKGLCEANSGLRIAACACKPLREIFTGQWAGSIGYSFLSPLELRPMEQQEIRRLLAHPWAPEATQFDEVTVTQIVADSAGLPFAVQRAAFHRFEALSDARYDWKAAWQRDLEQLL